MVIPFQIVVSGRGAGAGYGLRAQAAGRSAESGLELVAPTGDPLSDGAALGRALFPPAVRQLLLDVARGADEAGARLQIQLRVAAPELAGLPWEWMSLGQQALWQPGIREDYALVRVGAPTGAPAALPVALPLRLLIAAAPGYEAAADALGLALAEEVRAGRLIVDRLRDADPAGLAEALEEEPCHLLHLIAPVVPGAAGGPARASLPRLRLGRNIDPPALVGIVGEFAELRLVTLAGDGADSPAALAALGAALHDGSGLSTLALGGLDAAQAGDCCAVCYAAIAAGEPADIAATLGRVRLAESGGPWGDPQLFLAPGGEALFRIGAAAPERAPRLPRAPRAARPGPARHEEVTQPVRPIERPAPRPSRPPREVAADRPGWLTPRLVVLIVASLILALMVSQVIRRPEEAAPTPTAAPTTLIAPSPAPPQAPTPQGRAPADVSSGYVVGSY